MIIERCILARWLWEAFVVDEEERKIMVVGVRAGERIKPSSAEYVMGARRVT